MGYVNADRCDPSRPDEDRPLHHRTRDAIYMAMDELESPLFDYGPTEYVWVLTEVIRECAERIANRTGAA